MARGQPTSAARDLLYGQRGEIKRTPQRWSRRLQAARRALDRNETGLMLELIEAGVGPERAQEVVEAIGQGQALSWWPGPEGKEDLAEALTRAVTDKNNLLAGDADLLRQAVDRQRERTLLLEQSGEDMMFWGAYYGGELLQRHDLATIMTCPDFVVGLAQQSWGENKSIQRFRQALSHGGHRVEEGRSFVFSQRIPMMMRLLPLRAWAETSSDVRLEAAAALGAIEATLNDLSSQVMAESFIERYGDQAWAELCQVAATNSGHQAPSETESEELARDVDRALAQIKQHNPHYQPDPAEFAVCLAQMACPGERANSWQTATLVRDLLRAKAQRLAGESAASLSDGERAQRGQAFTIEGDIGPAIPPGAVGLFAGADEFDDIRGVYWPWTAGISYVRGDLTFRLR